MRFVWITGGIVATGLGLVGILLPIMPTVPFMILAAFCFGRSSPHSLDGGIDRAGRASRIATAPDRTPGRGHCRDAGLHLD
jgi:hypothetical protein